MALFVRNLNHIHENRPFKPLYARTQATPQDVTLDPAHEDDVILPGFVLTRLPGGNVCVCDGTTAPAGISGTFHNSTMGIDELGVDNEMAMWVLGGDALFEAHPGTYDANQDWAALVAENGALATGKAVYLKASAGSAAAADAAAVAKGALTLDGTTSQGTFTPATAPTANTVARLVDVPGDVLIVAGLL